jgi:phage major head subunit gpT-like protein
MAIVTERTLSSRAVVTEFYRTLEQDEGARWIGLVSNLFNSDQDMETYAWLGMAPAMREWIGGRNAKALREFDYSIKNKHYEATLEILVRHMRRDKSDQTMIRIRDLARRTNTHWASLLSTLILNGVTNTCYDGQFFFDTDHVEGDSGSQSNKIDVDISALPAAVHGSVTNPSIEEMQLAIVRAINQISTFLDDRGEPLNENAQSFLVLAGPSLRNQVSQAIQTSIQIDASQTALVALQQDFTITSAINVRLASWTDKFALFRTDVDAKALIRQQETPVQLKVKAEGSEFEFDNDAHQYGVDTWRNVGYGMWQNACLATMT